MMKLFYIFLIAIFSYTAAHGQDGIDFFHGSWEEAKSLAAKEKKLIFVDAYAKWCGPCKRMASQVFTNPSVGEYYNSNFINLKIDMEEGMGLTFRKEYPVSAFPTLFYIDETGEIVKKVVGGKAANDFIAIGKTIVASYDRSGQYVERYENGERDYDLVLEYVKALNQANKPSLKVANDFLRENPALNETQKSNFLFEALTNSDSRIFKLFIEDLDNIKKVKTKKEISDKIEAASWNTVYSAISFEVADLLNEAQNKMKMYGGDRADAFLQKSNFEYAQATSNAQMMGESALALSKGLMKNQPEELVTLGEELMLYQALYAEIGETAESIVAQALKSDDKPEYRLVYSRILLANNKKKKALKEAEKALKKSNEKDHCYQELEDLIQQIKAS